MKNYLDFARHILRLGNFRGNRTTTRALSVFGGELKFDLSVVFPIDTTKFVNFDAVVAELVAFLNGATSAADFRQLGTKIWDSDANTNKDWLANPHRAGHDDLGPIYGKQWRRWESVKFLKLDDPNFHKRRDAYLADGYVVEGSFPAWVRVSRVRSAPATSSCSVKRSTRSRN
jgi:thymidylate synthase